MKIALSMFVLAIASATCFGGSSTSSEYPIKVHVTSSIFQMGGERLCEYLQVQIDGKKYSLANCAVRSPLHVGDYQAKILKDETKGAARFEQRYELQFSDGKTTKYDVIGESE
jgi:hypothetical protein